MLLGLIVAGIVLLPIIAFCCGGGKIGMVIALLIACSVLGIESKDDIMDFFSYTTKIEVADFSDRSVFYDIRVSNTEKSRFAIKKIEFTSDGRKTDKTLKGWISNKLNKSSKEYSYTCTREGVIIQGKNRRIVPCYYEFILSGDGELNGKTIRIGELENGIPEGYDKIRTVGKTKNFTKYDFITDFHEDMKDIKQESKEGCYIQFL